METEINMIIKNIYHLLKYLSEPYEVQYELMEDFVRWNLPEEIGLEWTDDLAGIIPILQEHPEHICIEEICLLKDIIKNFSNAFKLIENEYKIIWSHESMKKHVFWNEQRKLANQAISLFEANHGCK